MFLVLQALGWSYDCDESVLATRLEPEQIAAVEALVRERIETRRPAAYLARRMWFAGHEFYVDERVLVPRSPLAEFIALGFAPWFDGKMPKRILDIGTGSGCIAIAIALALPEAQVDATDISANALAVAALNCQRHGVESRVTLQACDLFPPQPTQYDLIISNPPYVPLASMAALPAEYRAEPAGALVAGRNGLDCVDRILRGARARLSERGLLVVEVGEIWPQLQAHYPRLPFTWLEFEHGGEGIFVLGAADLTVLE